MSPSTQVALIALILFFAIVAVSTLWPRMTELKRSNMKLPTAIVPATIKVFRSAPLEVEAAPQGRPLSPDLRTDRWIWTTSTQHRIASGALGLGAILLLAFWLLSRDRAQRFFGSPLGVCDPVRLHLGPDAVLGGRRSPPDLGFRLRLRAGDAPEYRPRDPHGCRAAHLPDLGWRPTPLRNAAFAPRCFSSNGGSAAEWDERSGDGV